MLRHEDEELTSNAYLRNHESRTYPFKRVGRPRFNWTRQVAQDSWDTLQAHEHNARFDPNDNAHFYAFYLAALTYELS